MASNLHLLHVDGPEASAPVQATTLSSRIVAGVREALAARQLLPGDTLGTENEIAAHWKVSRIVARDALRSLQALGVVEIRVGAGGGARIAASNPDLFADAFGIQLDLMGVSPGEVLDSQRAIECLAAELASENGTAADHAALRDLLDRAARCTDDIDAFTGLSRRFHFAIARASHNRVLQIQLASLQHVSWPSRNRTLNPAVARRIQAVHEELAALIEMRNAADARSVMNDHVRMIGTWRKAEHAGTHAHCC